MCENTHLTQFEKWGDTSPWSPHALAINAIKSIP